MKLTSGDRRAPHGIASLVYRRFASTVALLLVICTNYLPLAAQEHDEDEFARGKPGLMVTWSDGDRTATTVAARLAFWLDADQSPHPVISPREFSGTWRGRLFVTRPGTYRFSADVLGEFTLAINGQKALAAGSGTSPKPVTVYGEPIELGYGAVELRARYSRSSANKSGGSVLRVWWQQDGSFREPLGSASLEHADADRTAEAEQWQAIEQGRLLVADHRCTRCHAPARQDDRRTPDLAVPGPSLDHVARWLRPNWVYHWLDRPRDFRPGTTMPRLFGESEDDRVDLYAVTELLTGGDASGDADGPDATKRVDVELDDAGIEAGLHAFASTGCIACHTALGEKRDAAHASDGIRLSDVAGMASKTSREGIRHRIASPQEHWPGSMMPAFKLEDDAELLDVLVDYLASSREPTFEEPPDVPPLEEARRRYGELVDDVEQVLAFEQLGDDDRWRTLGREVFHQRGCLNCHALEGIAEPDAICSDFVKLVAAAKTTDSLGGCLADAELPMTAAPTRTTPDFGFRGADQAAIRAFLASAYADACFVAPLDEMESQLDRIGCTACHRRDGRGGVFAERIERFVPLGTDQTIRDVEPPELSAVGEKLNGPWLHQVVAEGKRARPWMALKMPHYAANEVQHLARAMVAADGIDPGEEAAVELIATSEDQEIGRLLVGRTGFNCVSCHDVRGVEASGTRGPDLAGVVERVRHDWFRRWLLDPQRMSPGTRMPSVFFGGKSAAPQYHGGDPERQLAALWAYLAAANELPLPLMEAPRDQLAADGENPKLVPTDRPILARGFMNEHAGHRGIALGFPEGVHFGFDSAACQLTTVWSGEFVELGGWFGSGRNSPEIDGVQVLGEPSWRGPTDAWRRATAANSAVSAEQTAARNVQVPPRDVRFLACWANEQDAGFAYRVEVAPDRWLDIQERPAPLDAAKPTAFVRRFVVRGAKDAVRFCVHDALRSTSELTLLDDTGTPVAIDELAGDGSVEVDVARAAWVRASVGDTVWLVAADQVAEGATWVVEGVDEDRLSLWLAIPTSSDDEPVRFGVVYATSPADPAEAIGDLRRRMDRQRVR